MIEAVQIQKIFDKSVVAAQDMSFTIRNSEFVSVIGKSGAGKTTLFRMLNGSVEADQGKILIDGADMCAVKGRDKQALQKRIATIYQDFCLVDCLSCFQNVLNGCLPEIGFLKTLTGQFSKEQRERALSALNSVGLADKTETIVAQLSGGQKQRVAIARALVQNPVLLLADEPVASLDPYTSEQIMDLIKELQNRLQLTVIMNNHNVQTALKYSDRILGIREGKIVLDKPAAEVSEADLRMVYGGSYEEE